MENIRLTYESLTRWWFGLHYSRNQKMALLGIGVFALLISIVAVTNGNQKEIAAPANIAIEVEEAQIFVDVTGAVTNPGVYALKAKSRVIDAIKAAGNSQPGADLSTINLARVLNDGEQIFVDLTIGNNSGSGTTSRLSKKVNRGPININRATARELDSLDGIGPVIAKRIIDYRKINGSFISVDDLQKVSGIGAVKFAQIKLKVRV